MRKNGNVVLFLLFFLLLVSSCNKPLWRNPQHDVEQLLGRRLEQDEAEVVKLVIAYSAGISFPIKDAEYRKAIKDMSPLQYKEVIESAAKMVQSKPILALYKTGKLSEKVVKALVQTMKESVKNLQEYIDQKAMQYDLEH